MTPPGFSWDDEEARTVASMIAVFGKPVSYQQVNFAPITVNMWPQDPKLLPDAPQGSALRLTGSAADFPQPPAVKDVAIFGDAQYTVYQIDARIRGHFVLWLRK